MRWHDTDLVDRRGRIRAIVRPLGALWEVIVPGREVVRAADQQAGRVLALEMVLPPPQVAEGHR